MRFKSLKNKIKKSINAQEKNLGEKKKSLNKEDLYNYIPKARHHKDDSDLI